MIFVFMNHTAIWKIYFRQAAHAWICYFLFSLWLHINALASSLASTTTYCIMNMKSKLSLICSLILCICNCDTNTQHSWEHTGRVNFTRRIFPVRGIFGLWFVTPCMLMCGILRFNVRCISIA